MMNRKLRRSILWVAVAIGFSFCALTGYCQSIQTSIDKKDILIGEQIRYQLQFTLPNANYRIEFNVPDSFQHFEILDKIKSDSTGAQGKYLVLQNILLTSWDSGRWSIPSFPIKIRNTTDNAAYTLNTDEILINVGYAPADSSNQLRDIKPVMEVFYIDRSWIYIAAAILAGLILLVILYRFIRRRPKKQKPLFDESLSAYDEAIRGLKKLQEADLSDANGIKQFYTTLADIFKKYYSRRDQKNLLNKTTGEILLLLKEKGIDTVILSSLAEALRCGDAVKFAKYLPEKSEREKSLQQVKTAIDQVEKDQPLKQ